MRFRQNVTEVARHFADYINRVAFRGERFILMRGNKPVAELCPVPTGTRLGELPDLLAALPRLAEEDATALERDLAAAQAEITQVPVGDPWDS